MSPRHASQAAGGGGRRRALLRSDPRSFPKCARCTRSKRATWEHGCISMNCRAPQQSRREVQALWPPSSATQRELLSPAPRGCPFPASRHGQDTAHTPPHPPLHAGPLHRPPPPRLLCPKLRSGLLLPPSDHHEQSVLPLCLSVPLSSLVYPHLLLRAANLLDQGLCFRIQIFSRTMSPYLDHLDALR